MGKCKAKKPRENQKNIEKTKKKLEKTKKENPEVLGGGGSAKSLRILVLLLFFFVFLGFFEMSYISPWGPPQGVSEY